MKFDYAALGLLTLVAVETSMLLWKSPRRYSTRKFEKPIFVDTSVLMDGRILSIAKSGFITSDLVIPRSVILELQLLADKSDHEKRERARYGLDVVAELQAFDTVTVRMMDDGKATDGVDERLLELAKAHHGTVMTIDFNLNKVASVENVAVLNINELAQGLRMMHLPGERFSIELVEKGSDNHQAVGYLPDGTMVVVENASSKLGQVHTVECMRSLQTVAGKMMFARLVEPSDKQHVAKKQPNPVGRAPRREGAPKSQKPAPQPTQSKPSAESTKRQSSRKRPRTSKQNEASLLRTINEQ